MKNIWWFIIPALFIQEPASTDAAIFQIRILHLNLILINIIWLIATIIDIYIGYKIGKWTQKKFEKTKIVTKSVVWATRIENFIGKQGESFTLILLGIINFPYANSFLGSWLKISFKKLFLLIFIGDVIYWAIEWGINIGIRTFITNSSTALYTVIGIGLLFTIFSKAIFSRLLKGEKYM
jgi:hypothetical protein